MTEPQPDPSGKLCILRVTRTPSVALPAVDGRGFLRKRASVDLGPEQLHRACRTPAHLPPAPAEPEIDC